MLHIFVPRSHNEIFEMQSDQKYILVHCKTVNQNIIWKRDFLIHSFEHLLRWPMVKVRFIVPVQAVNYLMNDFLVEPTYHHERYLWPHNVLPNPVTLLLLLSLLDLVQYLFCIRLTVNLMSAANDCRFKKLFRQIIDGCSIDYNETLLKLTKLHFKSVIQCSGAGIAFSVTI